MLCPARVRVSLRPHSMIDSAFIFLRGHSVLCCSVLYGLRFARRLLHSDCHLVSCSGTLHPAQPPLHAFARALTAASASTGSSKTLQDRVSGMDRPPLLPPSACSLSDSDVKDGLHHAILHLFVSQLAAGHRRFDSVHSSDDSGSDDAPTSGNGGSYPPQRRNVLRILRMSTASVPAAAHAYTSP
jgi:hypothetical protein